MKYQDKEIEIIAKRNVFCKELADIRLIGDAKIFTLAITELNDSEGKLQNIPSRE